MTNPRNLSPSLIGTNASNVDQQPQSNNHFRESGPWFLLLFLGIAWGGSFSLAKIAVEEGAHPLGVNYWQTLIGAAILISYLLVARKPLPTGRNYLSFYLICGFLGSVIPGLLYFYAVSHISPGVLAITIATVPIMTYIAAALMKVERTSVLRLLGVCCGILSILLLILPTESLPDRSAVFWVFAAYVGLTLAHAPLLVGLDSGRELIFMAIITTFLIDTAAMLVGAYAGRSRLAPTISPKKSWEGAIAGVVAGVLAAIVIDAALGISFTTFTAAILGGLLAVTAILGDLYESWIKRRAGVKDSGKLIPGHGGILDRLDSVIPCLMVVYWTAVWSGT